MNPVCRLCHQTHTRLRYTLRDKKVFHCPFCRILFIDPFPDPSALKASYEASASEFQPRYFETFHDLRSRSFARALDVLCTLGRRGVLLDIGTGLGFFLEQAHRSGWEAEGLELSEKTAAYARQTLNLPVHVGTLEGASLKKGRYHVVTLWDVLEHLPDPGGVLLQTRTLLVPKGLVVIRTPLYDSLVPGVLNLLYRASCGRIRLGFEKLFKEHLFHFSEEGLRRLLERSGFRLLRAYREDYIDYRALGRKEWARNPLIRLGALVTILASHLLHRQDEVVMYAESS